MKKKKMILLGITIGLLDIFLLIATAAIVLLLGFMGVIKFMTPKPKEPEDDLSRLICEEYDDGFRYEGLYSADDSYREYRLELQTNDPTKIHSLIDGINEFISGNKDKIGIEIYDTDMGIFIGLYNFSSDSGSEADYDHLQSLAVYAEWGTYLLANPDLYLGIKDIRTLTIKGSEITDRLEEQGIYWREIWPELDTIINRDSTMYDDDSNEYSKTVRIRFDNESEYQQLHILYGKEISDPGIVARICIDPIGADNILWTKEIESGDDTDHIIYVHIKEYVGSILLCDRYEDADTFDYGFRLLRLDENGNEITIDEMKVSGYINDTASLESVREFEDRLLVYLDRSVFFAEVKDGNVITDMP